MGDRALRLLAPVFFLSGATSLVWQTVWERQLHLLLGTSGIALATVLAAFMAGLGIGGALGGRWRPDRPLRAYAVLEAAIGAYALVFPSLLHLATPLYLLVHRGPLEAVAEPVEALLAAILLLPPTVAMGATLPLLSRVVVDRVGTAAERVGFLYATNTAGAVAGTALAGLVLLPTVGLWATTVVTALGNGLVALAGWWLDPSMPAVVPRDDLDEDRPRSAPSSVGLVVAMLAGAAALGSEVVWTRMVGLLLGGTTYAFTAMLLAVLVGIAVGGRVGGTLADDALRYGGTRRVLAELARVELLFGVAAVALTFLWPLLPYVFVGAFDLFDGRQHPVATFLGCLGACSFALLLPSALMGTAFPYAVRAVQGDSGDASAAVGRVYAVNTAGGVLGAVGAAFVGIPWLGLRGTVAVTAVVALSGALGAAVGARHRLTAGLAASALVAALVVRAPWDPLWMNGGFYQYVTYFSDHTPAGMRRFSSHQQELLYEREGRSTVVTVGRNTDIGNLWLANNGKIDASSVGDMPTQVLVSLLGAQFVEHPRETMVIGLASGISAGAASLIPGVEHLQVVELEPAILDATRFFDPYNHQILDDPRLELVFNDGRNHVLRAPPGRWDLVVSEPSNPYLSGVSNLFTREFWEVGRTRLAPGGVWAQWVQIYGMGPDELRGLIRTFCEVYPHVAVYEVLAGADLVLLGADHPLVPTEPSAARLLASDAVARELGIIELHRSLDVVALHAMDREQALAFAGDAEPVTDDNLRVEYAAPLWLHTDVAMRNWDDLLATAHVPWTALGDEPLDWLDLADSYDALEDERRARIVRARAFGWLPPGSGLQLDVLARLAPQ
ncbi:MAG: fused MFS/spermidine synthase [Myxococcales bacterium]|nr:fused MFS/spermidine synthase [Myxococcales bacterium]